MASLAAIIQSGFLENERRTQGKPRYSYHDERAHKSCSSHIDWEAHPKRRPPNVFIWIKTRWPIPLRWFFHPLGRQHYRDPSRKCYKISNEELAQRALKMRQSDESLDQANDKPKGISWEYELLAFEAFIDQVDAKAFRKRWTKGQKQDLGFCEKIRSRLHIGANQHAKCPKYYNPNYCRKQQDYDVWRVEANMSPKQGPDGKECACAAGDGAGHEAQAKKELEKSKSKLPGNSIAAVSEGVMDQEKQCHSEGYTVSATTYHSSLGTSGRHRS